MPILEAGSIFHAARHNCDEREANRDSRDKSRHIKLDES